MQRKAMKKVLVTQKELCECLGISPDTFARDKIGDKIRCYKIGKRIKYNLDDVEKLRIKTW